MSKTVVFPSLPWPSVSVICEFFKNDGMEEKCREKDEEKFFEKFFKKLAKTAHFKRSI